MSLIEDAGLRMAVSLLASCRYEDAPPAIPRGAVLIAAVLLSEGNLLR